MKTATAYILALVAMPIVGTLVGIALLPFWFPAKRADSWLMYRVIALLSTIVSGFAMVVVGSFVFTWLDVRFTGTVLVVLFGVLTVHNLGRIILKRGTDAMSLEVAYSMGGFIGISTAGAVLCFGFPYTTVTWVLILPAAFYLYLWRVSRSASFPFWNLAARFPDEAYQWFLDDETWVICDPQGSQVDELRGQEEYSGPFRLAIPQLDGRIVNIYGRADQMEGSQQRFVEKYRDKGDA